MSRRRPDWLETAVALRQDGATLEAIGKRFGVTREYVRQRLRESLGTTDLALHKSQGYSRGDSDVFRDIASPGTLKRWAADGHIGTKRFGASMYFRVMDVLDYYVELMERQCQGPGCQEPVLNTYSHTRYCHKCRVAKHRSRYPFLNPGQRARMREHSARWKENHPEEVREMNRRRNGQSQDGDSSGTMSA